MKKEEGEEGKEGDVWGVGGEVGGGGGQERKKDEHFGDNGEINLHKDEFSY